MIKGDRRESIFLKIWIVASTCSFGYGIDDDGLGLLVTDSNRLLQVTVSDRGARVEEKLLHEAHNWICGIAYDPVEHYLYSRESYYGSIWATNLTDGNTEEILIDHHFDWYHDVCGMSLDKEARKLIYEGPDYHQISILDLETKQSEVLMNSPDVGYAMDITLDEEQKLIYWISSGYTIHTMDYNGTNYRQVVAHSGWTSGLSLDTEGEVLYWCHDNVVHSIKTDGTDEMDIDVGYCYDIVYVDQTLIFVTGDSSIYSVSSRGGNVTVLTSIPGTHFYRLQFISTDENECMEGTHNCTANSRCINTYSSFRCQCVTGYTQEGDNCTDKDECADNTDNCHEHAECSNTEGSFTCTCTGIFSGDGVTCIVPFYDEQPEITIELTPKLETSTSELTFYCNFVELLHDVMYSTIWSVNGSVIVKTDPEQWSSGEVIFIQALTEDHLKNAGIITMGFEVQCSVEAEINGSQTTSLKSLSKFIGIQFLSETSISLSEGGVTEVSLQLTAPFGCADHSEQCQLYIEAFTTEILHECAPTVLMPECGVVVDSLHWNDPIFLTLSGKITNTYGISSNIVELKLVTSSLEHQMWADYELGIIEVELRKDTATIEEKSCHSVNDPHLRTFDGRNYEHQYKGNFTFYKHLQLPLEVQIQTVSCGYGNIWCNCGVAVRAGRTVFEINRCPGQSDIWFIDYTLCEDGGDVLQVKHRGSNYDIFLPTGGKVSVNIYGPLLNVYMYPSVQDVEASAGLCGKLSDVCSDDFVLRNGTFSTDPSASADCNTGYRVWQNEMTSFSDSWRVLEGSNLFDHKDHGSLGGWSDGDKFCSCPHIVEREHSGNFFNTRGCSSGVTYDTCTLLPGYQPVDTTCSIHNRRRRSSLRSFERQKRQAESWPGNWTEESARSECEKMFKESSSVQVCGDIQGVDTNNSIEDCVLDILLTGTTDFGHYSVDTVRSKCLQQVVVNPILQENSSQSNESIYDMVTAQACPNDCTGHGNCSKGFCYCDDDFGGEDCSVDLTKPPFILDIHDNGHCDISEESCELISVYGETFTEGNTTCFVEYLNVTDGQIEHDYSMSGMAQVMSISHVQCKVTFTMTDNGDDDINFLRAYRISVSNDGVRFSNNGSLLVFDGTCITASINGTYLQWEKEESYCLHNGKCYIGGSYRIDNECIVCDSNGTSNTWRNSTEPPCKNDSTTITTPESSTKPPTNFTTKASPKPPTMFTTEPSLKSSTFFTTEPRPEPSTMFTTETSLIPSTKFTTEKTLEPSTKFTTETSPKSSKTFITETSLEPSTKFTTEPSLEPSTKFTTEPNPTQSSHFTTEPSLKPSTMVTNEPGLDPSTKFTTEPSLDPSTKFTTEPSLEPSTKFTTKPNPTQSSKFTTEPSLEPSTMVTTEPSLEPSTKFTTKPNPTQSSQFTTEPSLEPSTMVTTEPSLEPSTKLTTEPSPTQSSQFTTEPSLEPSTKVNIEPTTETTLTSTKPEYPNSSDKLGLSGDTISAIAVSVGIVAFILLVTAITFLTVKLRKQKGSQSTETAFANEFPGVLDARDKGSMLRRSTDTQKPNASNEGEIPRYWDALDASRGGSFSPRFIPRVNLKSPQMYS